MLMISNLLALALIAADQPTPMPKMATPSHHHPEADETWNLSLRDAIRIGLEHTESVRMVAGPNLTIARANADVSPWNFRASIAAHVRSVEQTYWALSAQQAALAGRETAVRLASAILRRERANLEVGQATTADVAEAEQQRENFELNVVSATSDVIATDRNLRKLLGLPAVDNRRIVPETGMNRTRREVDWTESVALMMARNPEIAEQDVLMRRLALDIGNNEQLTRQAAVLGDTIRNTTHTLARFTLEIDANYKLFRTAEKLKAAAEQRLKAQQAFYEEGRITIDRLLDAVSQRASAIAQESQYLALYNTSIAAFEEAKGTILAADGITIADSIPDAEKPALDPKLAPTAFEAPAPALPTTYKLRAKVGGRMVIEVEVEVQQPKPPAPAVAEPGR